MQLRRRDEFLLLVIDFHAVAVGIAEAVGAAAAEIAVAPADAEARVFERLGATLQRLRAGRAPGDAADAGIAGGGELQRRGGVVAIAAQVDRLLGLVHRLHAEQVAEIPQALVGHRREQLHAAQMRDVVDRLGLRGHDGLLPLPRLPARIPYWAELRRDVGRRFDLAQSVSALEFLRQRVGIAGKQADIGADRDEQVAPARCSGGLPPHCR